MNLRFWFHNTMKQLFFALLVFACCSHFTTAFRREDADIFINKRLEKIYHKMENLQSIVDQHEATLAVRSNKIIALEKELFLSKERITVLERKLNINHRLPVEHRDVYQYPKSPKIIDEVDHTYYEVPTGKDRLRTIMTISTDKTNHSTKSSLTMKSTGEKDVNVTRTMTGLVSQTTGTVVDEMKRLERSAGGFSRGVGHHGNKRIKHDSSIIQRQNDGIVAFYAYMSRPEPDPGAHHTLIFDVQKTNVGNAYNRFNGMFTVPEDGVYFFSWTIPLYCHSVISTEIVKNNNPVGAITSDQEENCDNDDSTGNVIVEAMSGDVVFIRTHSQHFGGGTINSDHFHWASFSGFRIM